MKLFELISILQEAQVELGPDADVLCYSGYSYDRPPEDEDESYPVADVVTIETKSYKIKSKKVNGTNRIFIQYGE